MSYDTFDIHPDLLLGIRVAGLTSPTPIQRKALPVLHEGRDLLAQVHSGTGKTAAYLLPLLQRLHDGRVGVPRALIITPTRELAENVAALVRELGIKIPVRTVALYGGVGINPQISRLRRGADVIVACPGRLKEHLRRRTLSLENIEYVVIDEADHNLEMGFGKDLESVIENLPEERQSLVFSATLPKEVRQLAAACLKDPVEINVGRVKPSDTMVHALYPVPFHLKTPLLREVMTRMETGSVLVFTRTRHRARRVAQALEKSGFRTACLEGNLPRNRRLEIIGEFADGHIPLLVATDIAARGMDFSRVSHVINYDVPNTPEAYAHRVGRTGEVTGTGEVLTFVTEEDASMVRNIEKLLEETIERRTLDNFDYEEPRRVQGPARPAKATGASRNPKGKRPAAGASKEQTKALLENTPPPTELNAPASWTPAGLAGTQSSAGSDPMPADVTENVKRVRPPRPRRSRPAQAAAACAAVDTEGGIFGLAPVKDSKPPRPNATQMRGKGPRKSGQAPGRGGRRRKSNPVPADAANDASGSSED